MKKELKVLTFDEAIKQIEAWVEQAQQISLVDFSLLSEEYKLKYAKTAIDLGRQIHPWLFNWLSHDLKNKIIQSTIDRKGILTEVCLKYAKKEDRDKYLLYRLEFEDENSGGLCDFELSCLSEDILIQYILKRIEAGKDISMEHFLKVSVKDRIKYIFNQGYKSYNIEIEMKEWFEAYKKAIGRDIIIDDLLT